MPGFYIALGLALGLIVAASVFGWSQWLQYGVSDCEAIDKQVVSEGQALGVGQPAKVKR